MSYASNLTEDCTIWTLVGRNEFNEYTFSDPRVIKVRYQDKIQKLIDDNGTEFISSAIVYATEGFPKNTFVYRGISTEPNPKEQQDAYILRIAQRSQNPSKTIVVFKHTI